MHNRLMAISLLVVAMAGAAMATGVQRRVPDADSQREPERKAQPRAAEKQPPDRRAQPRPENQASPQRRAQPRPPARSGPAPAPRPHRGPAVRGEIVFIGGYFYDPYFGPYPWWPRPLHPHSYFPLYDMRAHLRIEVKPKDASVYVDGYYAGIVDDFDGFMQSLPLPPGGHEIALYLEGFRGVRRSLYLRPGSHLHVREMLQPLGPGEPNEPPPVAQSVPAPPEGTYTVPHTPNPRPPAVGPPPATQHARPFGTLDLRVEPPDADVTVDGHRWLSSDEGHFVIELPAGTHTVEVAHPGVPTFSSRVIVREGKSTPFNVSLME